MRKKAQNVTLQMELTVPEQILASVSGAGITALTMTPFDVVKGIYHFLAIIRGWTVQKKGTFDFSENLIRTPSGNFNQVFEEF